MNGDVRKPNLFIVGAPKSGTTALWSYLSAHPDVYAGGPVQSENGGSVTRDRGVPQGKEYYYFGSDLRSNIPVRRSLEAYMQSFTGATDERYLIDASPMYLCSVRAASEIVAFSPDARAIAMLRNPVDMMYSLHGEALFNGDEDIADFEEALAAEEDRRQGKRIPPTCRGALWSLFYRDVASYADQLERYFDAFGRDRVHVIVFDDFATDPATVYRATLAFLELDVDEDHLPDFGVVNAHKAPRSATVVRLLREPPPVLRSVTRALVRNQATRRALGLRAQQLNARREQRQPLQPALRGRLQAELAPDVRRLGRLIDRNLSSWIDPSSLAVGSAVDQLGDPRGDSR
jgi:Sulfotransferase family